MGEIVNKKDTWHNVAFATKILVTCKDQKKNIDHFKGLISFENLYGRFK